MNIYTHLIVAAVVAMALGVSHYWAYERGIDHQIAESKSLEDLVRDVEFRAQQGAASEISKIQVTHETIQNDIYRTIRRDVVYADCKHSPDGLRYLNQALVGKAPARPASGSQLSASQPSR